MIPQKFRNRNPSEVHHIFSVRRRWDLLSNIIHISHESHVSWCHAFPIDSRILCLLVKARKGELDHEEIRKASGMYPAGWLAKSKDHCRMNWMDPYVAELCLYLE